ncbi:DUF92 domain-containing protein [candidate division KSB1 bacterium]|nr:DUF92 domain-containing protein [candidate division KSB1 bacterium]
MDWFFLGVFFIGLIMLIGITEGIRRSFHWAPEATRKVVHIATGLLIAATPLLIKSRTPLLLIAAAFAIVNAFAIRFNFLKGMHSTNRHTYGTVFYPLAFILLLLLFWENHKAVLIISVLIMAIADALAAIVGENIAHQHHYNLIGERKSIEGSITMFAATLGITFSGLKLGGIYNGYEITTAQCLWTAVIVGIIAVVTEALSRKGSDNLSVPLSVGFILHFMVTRFNSGVFAENIQLTIGVGLGMLIVIGSFYVQFLDASGAISTFLLAVLVFGVGGWKFGFPILTFFILSSLLSRVGKEQKKQLQQTYQKSSRRDLGQVIANGGIAGALVLIWNFERSDLLYYLYLGALAAVTADTWGTEIGFFAKKMPRLILNFKPVARGTSGGITIEGTLAGFAGATIIGFSGWLTNPSFISWHYMALIGFSGLFASFIDSLLGATIQAQFKCPKCQKITEKAVHCGGVATQHELGLKWVDNDMVNIICAFFGVLFVWFGIYLAQ